MKNKVIIIVALLSLSFFSCIETDESIQEESNIEIVSDCCGGDGEILPPPPPEEEEED